MRRELKYTQQIKAIRDLKPKTLLKILEIVYDFKGMFEQGGKINTAKLGHSIPLLTAILDYLIANMQVLQIDNALLIFLENILGKNIKEKENDQGLRKEKEEQKISKAEKERRYKLVIYEFYKIISPHRLAGETSVDNFIHNVRAHGIKYALKHEGNEHIQKFHASDLEKLESGKASFVEQLKGRGVIPGGRGI